MNLLRSVAFNIAMFGSGFVLSLWATGLRMIGGYDLVGVPKLWGRLSLRALALLCGIRVEVVGRENLPSGGGALIAAQHQSALDILIWLALLPRPAYVLKQELQRIPLFGPLLVPSGMIAIDRAGGANSLRGMVAACRAAIADGRQIIIFPEGTRVAHGQRTTLQPGIVALAKALNVPVIPAATDTGRRWGRRSFVKTPGLARVKLFAPLAPNLPRAEILAALTARFYQDGVD